MEPAAFFDPPERKSFLGTGWAFPPTFSLASCGALTVSGEEDIDQSLQILFGTSLGERVMLPEYGCNLRDYLFAPINTTLLSYLEDLIGQAIVLHEPRLKLLSVVLLLNDLAGRLDITVECVVRSTNTRFNRVYPFYYQEGTNVSP